MPVQLVPSFEVWIWNALPAAASQFRSTDEMVWVAPRSTWSHCGSENADDHRVPVLPSVAAEAGKAPVFSDDEAVAGRPWESSVSPGGGVVVPPSVLQTFRS
jgi:hypothetical protein